MLGSVATLSALLWGLCWSALGFAVVWLGLSAGGFAAALGGLGGLVWGHAGREGPAIRVCAWGRPGLGLGFGLFGREVFEALEDSVLLLGRETGESVEEAVSAFRVDALGLGRLWAFAPCVWLAVGLWRVFHAGSAAFAGCWREWALGWCAWCWYSVFGVAACAGADVALLAFCIGAGAEFVDALADDGALIVVELAPDLSEELVG